MNDRINQNIQRHNLLKGVLRCMPAIAWMSVIFYSSSQTGDDVGKVLPFVQSIFPFITDFNFMHVISYFVLAITFDMAFGFKSTLLKYKIIIVILCVVYGITDEIHQNYVGGRTPDILDVRNDGLGALLWVLVVGIPPIKRIWIKLTRKN